MPKVMIVEDEREVVELLKFLLEKEGIETIVAFNGREALEKIGLMPSAENVVRPDLMILDIMMPEIDGYTVQTKMLENANTKSIPIAILTAKGHMQDLFGMAANVAAYIEKPFDPQALREKIKELLKK